MKTKAILFSILGLLFYALEAFSQPVNRLSIPVTDGKLGQEVLIPVYMTNDAEITGVQVNIRFPQGSTVNTQGVALTDRRDNHTISVNPEGNNNFMFIIFSASNKLIKGNSGILFNIPVTVPINWLEDNTYPFVFNQVILSAVNGDNLATTSEPGGIKVMVEPRPDFTVDNIQTDKSSVVPGETFSASWTVKNIGDKASAVGWTERVTMVDDNGKQTFLGSLYQAGVINAGGLSNRQTEFIMPQLPGMEGDVKLSVQIIPDPNSGELPGAQGNNTARSDLPFTLTKKLFLTLPSFPLPEGSSSLVQCKLSRSGSWAEQQVFALSADDPARITVPTSVTVPANQSGALFYIQVMNNNVLDDDSIVAINAWGSGYDIVAGEVKIDDANLPSLTLTGSKAEVTQGETFTLTVERERISTSALLVTLTCNIAKRFDFPAQVTIPANQKSVVVNVTAIDDKLPDIDRTVEFTASAPKNISAKYNIILHNSNLPEITLTLTPDAVGKSAGLQAIKAVLRRLTLKNNQITVELSDNSGGKLYYANKRITLQPGVEEVQFTIGVIDNDLVDGDQTVEVTAAVYVSSCGCAVSGTSAGIVRSAVTILDTNSPALKIVSSQPVLPEGKTDATILTVTKNTPPAGALTVTVSSTQDEDLIYNKTVTIPAGSVSVQVPVSVRPNDTGVSKGDRTVVFTATTAGYKNGTCWAMISDQTLPDAVISSIGITGGELTAEGKADVQVVVRNSGAAPLQARAPVNVYLSNSTNALFTLETKTVLAVGGSETLTAQNITLPNLAGNFTLHAVVNEKQAIKELLYLNNTSEKIPVKLLPKFTATTTTNKTVYRQGEEVIISGQLAGSVTALTAVEVYLISSGTRQVLEAATDETGRFQITYQPSVFQSGRFTVGACYPKEGLTEAQATFDIYGLRREGSGYITHDLLVNEPHNGTIRLTNTGVLQLSNVRAEIISTIDNASIVFVPAGNIAGNATGSVSYTLTGNAPSDGTEWQQIKIRIISDESELLELTLHVFFRTPKGKLQADISSIRTTMTKGTSRDYPFTITNMGKGETGKISISLPANAKWLSTATPREMASLASNETATVILRFTPTNDLPLNVPITGTIGVNCENGTGFPLSFSVEPVSEATGTLLVDVCNEYTYYTEEAPHLAGAKVSLKHPVTNALIAEGLTGQDGLFVVNNLPEGYYALEVSAEKHDRYRNNIIVDPGRVTKKVVNLSFQAITIDWDVEETEVEDEYDITTTVKFETNVPVPVILIETPNQIPVDELLDKGYYFFNAVITNKGLITAEDVQMKLPDDPDLLFECPAIDNLKLRPQESIVVPIKVTVKGSSPSPSLRSSNAVTCKKYIVGGIYFYYCGLDKKWHQFMSIPINIGYTVNCPNPGTGGGGGGGGGGGLSGPGGGGGGGGYTGGGNNPNVPTITEDCEPCAITIPKALIGCIPGLGCLINEGAGAVIDLIYSAYSGGKANFWETAKNFIIGVVKCEAQEALELLLGVKLPGCIMGILSAIMECTKIEYHSPAYPAFRNGATNPLEAMYYNMEQMEKYVSLLDASFFSIFPKETWGKVDNMQEFIVLFFEKTNSSGLISADGIEYVKTHFSNPFISNEDIQSFADRWNRSVGYWNQGYYDIEDLPAGFDANFITLNSLKVDDFNQINEFGIDNEYVNLSEMFGNTLNYLENYGQDGSAVCASITLQFSQTMTMTRQAFRGTLTVFNGHESIAMEDVKLNLVVKDQWGNVATSHEFQINNESLKDFGGTLNGYWSLDAQKTGVATILFIPTKFAAPSVPVDYSFGGSLSYIDPFSGLVVTRELFPVTMTVKPSPNLDLTYFMQRDILGDDPLTPEIEPIVPAEFSLLIHNVGEGEATNVRMVTQQPKIVDNQKGLFIEFELLSSQLKGGDHTLALGSSVATDFGNIKAGKTTYAQWWFTSTLLGHFVEYDVKATHVTSYGNPDLTLLNEVTIHELIRSIRTPDGQGSFLTGFVVNDIIDEEDLPDRIYLSDGTILPVVVTSNILSAPAGANQYQLTITPAANGWNYGSINDPTGGNQQLLEIKRLSDNAIIDLRNFWQTDRTLRDGKDPLRENKLHFVDKMGDVNEQYLLTFSPRPNVFLAVEAFEGIPAALAAAPVMEVTVVFNKNIVAPTFTSDDIRLNCQGVAVDASMIDIIQVNERTFKLDLSAVTESDGYYVLTIQTSAITDFEGFQGRTGKTADWNQFFGGKMQFNLQIEPEAGGIVTPPSGKFDFAETLNLQATPNEGYDFDRWSINAETLSTSPSYNFTLLSSKTLTASFKLKLYDVAVNFNSGEGSVSGGGTGKYAHGSQMILRAEPLAGYAFFCWKVDGIPATDFNLLDIQVKSDVTIEAVFTRLNCTATVSLGGNRNITGYGSVLLDAGSGFKSYRWSTGDNTRIVSIANPDKLQTITVWVEVTAFDGCTARDEITITYSPLTGLDELESKDESVKVFPNPTVNNVLNIWFTYPEQRDIRLYDLLGNTVYSKTHSEEKVTIELPQLKAGIYLLKVNNRGVEKIIVR